MIPDFKSEGFVLDIGGGGEGVIGRLKGRDVVAIDNYKQELEDSVEGPLKIVMDAKELMFLDETFNTATAFFTMMYIKNTEDQQKVLSEIWRVLKPRGRLHIWDLDLDELPQTDKEFYLVKLRYLVGTFETGTGYGMRWPTEPHSETYYKQLAEKTGFQLLSAERVKHTFYHLYSKP
ncbi:MAG: class I SAM-dependent methyltransferase [Anaerolineaceae bacterium]|nr:class I SAM-dependent methyltransferase [Anaerolineaceae bacterium]